MIDDMGIFRTTIEVAAGAELTNRRRLADVLIDTGSEWVSHQCVSIALNPRMGESWIGQWDSP